MTTLFILLNVCKIKVYAYDVNYFLAATISEKDQYFIFVNYTETQITIMYNT